LFDDTLPPGVTPSWPFVDDLFACGDAFLDHDQIALSLAQRDDALFGGF
jgi:hypothetical protein